jgi:hypothetical protein
MAFLRLKPVRKGNKVYYYVYEVESYKEKGKVRQRTVRFLGKYIKLGRKQQKYLSNKLVEKHDSVDALFKEIFALQLPSYGFRPVKENVFAYKSIIADLEAFRIFDSETGKDVYINVNEKFFGTHTLSKLIKADHSDLVEFVKAIVDSGAVNKETKQGVLLLQRITEKFRPKTKMEESSFKDFAKDVGY